VNPSTALATVLVDELVRQGVRHLVLCPGSRSAPLAYAAQDAARAGRLTLHVRVDERSAGFLAVGLAKLTRVPAVVVTTSGTAVANLHPAVLEAHHAVVPLVVLSADRPAELRGTGANQTTVQPGMFGRAVRWEHDLAAPDPAPAADLAEARSADGAEAGADATAVSAWRALARTAVGYARGDEGVDDEPGPVHLNVQLREPLVPTDDDAWSPDLLEPSAPGSGTLHDAAPPASGTDRGRPTAAGIGPTPRTLVVVGDLPASGQFEHVLAWAASHGWPVVAEPFGGHPREDVVRHGPLVLSVSGWLDSHRPDRVVTVGRVTLSRPVAALMRRPDVRLEAVRTHRWVEATPGVSAVHDCAVLDVLGDATDVRTDGWRAQWQRAGAAVADAVAAEPPPWPTGPAVARSLLGQLPDGSTLFVGSSNSVRDLDVAAVAGGNGITVVASRGLAGIDGCVSTAVGLALAGDGATYALMGDLTFLHDSNGLLIGPHEPVPDLTLVVVNDDGGGIFTLLEPGEPARAADFERIFGTPTGTDLSALCVAHGVAHQRISSPEDFASALRAPGRGIRVLEVGVERDAHRTLHARMRQLAAEALS
jgi:2-succinyl-5-enolpyruvyl-6-hydroxy-3-cyclohexene-1-carboxylate synthase